MALNKDIVQKLYTEVLSGGDIKLAEQYVASDVVLHNAVAVADGTKGIDAFIQFFSSLRASFPDLTFNVEQMVEEGDIVADRTTMTGTFTGVPFRGMPPTKRAISVTTVGMNRFVNGMIVERWGSTTGWL